MADESAFIRQLIEEVGRQESVLPCETQVEIFRNAFHGAMGLVFGAREREWKNNLGAALTMAGLAAAVGKRGPVILAAHRALDTQNWEPLRKALEEYDAYAISQQGEG